MNSLYCAIQLLPVRHPTDGDGDKWSRMLQYLGNRAVTVSKAFCADAKSLQHRHEQI